MKFLISVILMFSVSVMAAEKTTVKTSDVKAETGNAIRGDIDTEITDTKMRVNSGSKSKYSASLSLGYNGASISKPFANVRPNIDGGRAEPVSGNATVGVRYRVDKNNSLFFATGLSKSRPFENQKGDEWEVYAPMAHYISAFRIKNIQMRSGVLAYLWTQDFFKEISQVGTLAYYLGTMSQLGNSRFEAGLGSTLSYTYFEDELGSGRLRGADVRSMQTDFSVDLRPRLQFRINDRFNLYTDIGLASFSHTREAKDFDMEQNVMNQTIGAGIAIARDFYLAPNLDFRPEDIRADNTSVNISAIINVL